MSAKHYRWSDLPKEALKPDLHRRLITTDRMMLAHVYLDAGAVVPKHRAEALVQTLDVDIFCPPREDWLDGSDAYLRDS